MAEDIFYCENCGGVMEFDVASQKLKCPNCDNVINIANIKENIVEHKLTAHAMQTVRAEQKDSTTMECRGCGAKLEVRGNEAAAACPYCGASYVLSQKQEEVIIPDGVIPFQIDKTNAREIVGRWLKKRYLAPGELKTLYQRGDIFGMYVPYWTFDADAKADYTGMGGRNRTEHYRDKDGNTHTRTVTDWYPTRGRVHTFFDDVLISASSHQNKSLLSGVDNYNTKQLVSYSKDYFSGYGVETYNINLDTAHSAAVGRMQEQLRDMARRDILRKYDTAKDIRLQCNFAKETYKHVLFPVYTVTYHYKNKVYNVLINGQNGNISGQYPKSFVKILLIILVSAAVILGIIFASLKDSAGSDFDRHFSYEEYLDADTIICYDNINMYDSEYYLEEV